jgi:hypothetical protein
MWSVSHSLCTGKQADLAWDDANGTQRVQGEIRRIWAALGPVQVSPTFVESITLIFCSFYVTRSEPNLLFGVRCYALSPWILLNMSS